MAKRDNLIRRLSMLLLAIALALLMIHGGSLARADDMEVPEVASETDASPTDSSTEATTESTTATSTEATTEVVQENATTEITESNTETSTATKTINKLFNFIKTKTK